MAAPRVNPHDPEPSVTRLRPGDTDPATGARVPGRASGIPRHVDGTPMTDEEIRAELEAPDRRPWDRRAPAKPKAKRAGRAGRRPSWSGRAAGQATFAPVRISGDATGFVLALLAWGWVILPALRAEGNQAAAVANVLRAKFFNRGPDGWLP